MAQACYPLLGPVSLILLTCTLGSPPNPPNFADSSGPLFFMYRKMAEEEDNKVTERWKKGCLMLKGFWFS